MSQHSDNRSEHYLAGTVDKIITFNGAAISFHRLDVALLHHHLLNRGALQNLNPWMGGK